jgi:hypothetical protein
MGLRSMIVDEYTRGCTARLRKLGFVLVILAIPCFEALDAVRAQDPAQWYTLTALDGSFAVDLPLRPRHMSTRLKTATGHPYVLEHYLVQLGAVAFVVQTAIHPQGANVLEQRASAINSLASTMEGGRWVDIKELMHEGLPAVDGTGQRHGHTVRVFSIINGLQIITLTYVGPPGSAKSSDVDRFIGSLRLKK